MSTSKEVTLEAVPFNEAQLHLRVKIFASESWFEGHVHVSPKRKWVTDDAMGAYEAWMGRHQKNPNLEIVDIVVDNSTSESVPLHAGWNPLPKCVIVVKYRCDVSLD